MAEVLAVKTSLSSHSRVLRAVLCCGAVLLGGCLTAAQPARDPRPALRPGLLAEGEVGGAAALEATLELAPRHYVRLAVAAPLDTAVSLTGPGGETLGQGGGAGSRRQEEVVSFLTAVAGTYRLAVTPLDPQAAPGRAVVTLQEARPALATDTARVAAERAEAEALRWRAREGSEANRQALERLTAALSSWREAGDGVGEVRVLNLLGQVQRGLGLTQEARASYSAALALSERTGDRRGEAEALNNLGVAFQDDPPRAFDFYQRALALWRELGDPGEEGKVLYAVGRLYLDRGDTDQALELLNQALPLRRAVGDRGGESRTLTALGFVFQMRGESDRAKALFEEALPLGQSAEDLGAEVAAFHNLAGLLSDRGELDEALRLFQEALDLSRRIGNPYFEGTVLQNLGGIYHHLGQPQEALTHYEAALALSRKARGGDLEEATLVSIGSLHLSQGEAGAALDLCGQALTLNPKRVTGLRCRGRAAVALGRPAAGLQDFAAALALLNEQPVEEAKILLDMAVAEADLGQSEAAAARLGKVLETGRQTGNTGLQVAGRFQLAKLERRQGRLQEALKTIKEALEVIESIRNRVPDENLRTSFFAAKRDYYELYMNLLMELDRLHPGEGYRTEALEASERARARSLLDLLSEGRLVEKGVDAGLKKREIELEAQLSGVQAQLSKSATAADPETVLWRQLRRVQDELEQLQEEIRQLHPVYAKVRFPEPLRVAQVHGLLDGRTALLEYFLGQEASFLFVVTREGVESFRLPPAAELAAAVDEFRSLLEDPGSAALGPFAEKAHRLYTVLLGPAAGILAHKESLLIAPDRSLYLLPFEALLTRADKGPYKKLPYLLRRYAVSYVPSASVLEELRSPREEAPAGGEAAMAFVAFADPVYAGEGAVAQADDVKRDGSPVWPRLTHSEQEVERIASLYPEAGVQLYLRELASKRNVLDNPLLERARRIHFATHAFLDEARPQLSALVLSRADAEAEDLLQVYEIFNLSLHADLLVLSACKTGGGREIAGEGMVGLTRAFLYAGARSLVVSLWPISDRSTPEIMIRFYRNLEAGQPKAEALRQAKLELIEHGYSRPSAWAPYILAGDFH